MAEFSNFEEMLVFSNNSENPKKKCNFEKVHYEACIIRACLKFTLTMGLKVSDLRIKNQARWAYIISARRSQV
jgi:hypothetical protein